MSRMTKTQIQTRLAEAETSFPHTACLTCECFLGYVAQLRLDADEDGKELLAQYKVERDKMHSCLGCDPCPPGDLSVAYIREKRKNTLITI